MRLTITSGMADARVRIDPDATDLIAIDWGEGTPPRLRVSASELRVSWPDTIGSWLRAALAGEYRDIEIVLHPAVEWTLQIRGGLSRFEADLASGKLARLDISGGVSDARLDLPPPGAVVPIRISGGVSDLALRRPADTGVALAVSGGISGLCLDDQGFDAIGGERPPRHRVTSTATPPATPSRSAAAPAACTSFLVSLARRRSPAVTSPPVWSLTARPHEKSAPGEGFTSPPDLPMSGRKSCERRTSYCHRTSHRREPWPTARRSGALCPGAGGTRRHG